MTSIFAGRGFLFAIINGDECTQPVCASGFPPQSNDSAPPPNVNQLTPAKIFSETPRTSSARGFGPRRARARSAGTRRVRLAPGGLTEICRRRAIWPPMVSTLRGCAPGSTRAERLRCSIATSRVAERTHGLAGDRRLFGDRPPPDRLVRAAPGLPQLPDGSGDGGRVSRRTRPRAAERAAGETAAPSAAQKRRALSDAILKFAIFPFRHPGPRVRAARGPRVNAGRGPALPWIPACAGMTEPRASIRLPPRPRPGAARCRSRDVRRHRRGRPRGHRI